MSALIPAPSIGTELTELTELRTIAHAAVARFAAPTQRAYRAHILSYLSLRSSLTREGISVWLSDRKSYGAGPVTLNIALAALKLLSREVWIRGLMPGDTYNAIADIRGEKKAGKRLGQWTDEKGVEELLEACADNRERALIAVMCGCGLRRAEVAGLQWDQYQEWHGRKIIGDVKGKGNKFRSVAVPEWAASVIDEYQKETKDNVQSILGSME